MLYHSTWKIEDPRDIRGISLVFTASIYQQKLSRVYLVVVLYIVYRGSSVASYN